MRLLRRFASGGTVSLLAGLAGGLALGYVLGRRGEWLVVTPWVVYLILLLLAAAVAAWLDLRFRKRPRPAAVQTIIAPAADLAPTTTAVAASVVEPPRESVSVPDAAPAPVEPLVGLTSDAIPAQTDLGHPARSASASLAEAEADAAEPDSAADAEEPAEERLPIPLRPRGAGQMSGGLAGAKAGDGASGAVPRPIRADVVLPETAAGNGADRAAGDVEDQ